MKNLLLAFVFLLPLSAIAEGESTIAPSEPVAISDAVKFSGDSLLVVNLIEELFASSKKVNSGGAAQTESRGKIENALDWDKVAQLCLGSHWKSANAKNKSEFRNLLKQVIIKTAYTRLDTFWTPDLTYKFEKVDIKGSEARVPTKFTVKGEPFVLEYFLQRKGKGWAIYDIAYEDVRYSVNINEQIDAFLKEKSMNELLGKLRKRLEDLNSGKVKKSDKDL